MASIQYNGAFPFSGQPNPFVGRVKNNINYGERWGAEQSWTIAGQITGCQFGNLTSGQLQVLNGFKQDFGTLNLIENGSTIESLQNVIIQSITFDNDKYVNILPYKIQLKCYPSSYFSGYYGVLEPKDSWDMKEGKDGILDMVHTVAARGFNTTSGAGNAYQNAINFVSSRTGFSNFVAPVLIQNWRNSGLLFSVQETSDRMNGIYSVIENWRLDQYQPCDYGILRYSIDTEQNQAGFNRASIRGTIQGGYLDNFANVRARMGGFDAYSALLYTSNSGVLFNNVPLSQNINEDSFNKRIEFSYAFDDNPNPQIHLEYGLNITSGDELITTSINGQIFGRGDLLDKWQKVRSYYSGFNPYILANSGYLGYAGGSASALLNYVPTSESIVFDSFNGNISFSLQYNNKELPQSIGFEQLTYGLSFVPPLRRIVAEPLIDTSAGVSKYQTTDLGYVSRGIMDIQGNFVAQRNITGAAELTYLKQFLNKIYFDYSSGLSNLYLEDYKISVANTNNGSFNTRWSYDAIDTLGNTGNYTQILSL